jgi:hypothetical protein
MTDQDAPSLDRAVRDYLACSRNPDLYSSPDDYARAEEKWWELLQRALAREHIVILEQAAGE